MSKKTLKNPSKRWDKLPDVWMLNFSTIIKPSLVRKLMVCRSLKKGLTTNTAWLLQCEDLEDFGSLTHYEKYVMIQEEGFWYSWYNKHCPRYIPIVPPRDVTFHTRDWTMTLAVPEVGSIFSNPYSDPNGPIKTKVCAEIIPYQKGKNATIPSTFKLYDCWDTLDNILKKKRATTKLYGVTEVKIRETGNFSVDLSMLKERDYPK